VKGLLTESHHYKALAYDVKVDNNPDQLLSFWRRNGAKLPTWFKVFQLLVLLQPSSASVERVLATFQNIKTGKEQALEETLESALLLWYNHLHKS